jgi:cyanophycinase-like exopeptidase
LLYVYTVAIQSAAQAFINWNTIQYLFNTYSMRQQLKISVLSSLLIGGLTLGWLASPAQARLGNVTRIRLGNSADAKPQLQGPSYFLQGDGTPNPTAYQSHINQTAATPVDVVVLAASEAGGSSPTPECDNLIELSNVNSCETVVISTPTGAYNPVAVSAVKRAEVVYFAGGNQCDYVGWQGSWVMKAAQSLVSRGGGIGGGSAGLAIQGDYVYDACNGSVTSQEALNNPYRASISFSNDLFSWLPVQQVVTDSHFVERDRMGRLMTFVARQIQDGLTPAAYGLGIDDNTSMVIDKNGLGTVYGGVAYMVLGDHPPEQCVAGKPLTYSNFKIWQLPAGSTYDFANRPTTGYYLRSVTQGKVNANPYTL